MTEGEVVAVIQNVGDRKYAPAGVGYEDSFTRNVKLTRVVRVGTKTSTQEIGVSDVPWVNVGEKIQFGFKRPKNVAAATQYTWILTIDGDDPDLTNNTFNATDAFIDNQSSRYIVATNGNHFGIADPATLNPANAR